jgi:hypothetical protein
MTQISVTPGGRSEATVKISFTAQMRGVLVGGKWVFVSGGGNDDFKLQNSSSFFIEFDGKA